MSVVIHWFRRDLRITDNVALTAAARDGDAVVPVYVASTWRGAHAWTGAHRQEFLIGCLHSLDANLREVGSGLVVREGEAVAALLALAAEVGAGAIYANRDPDPFGRAMEARLIAAAGPAGVEVKFFKDVCVFERDEVLTATGTPFRVFSPYARAWRKLERPRAAGRIRKLASPAGVGTRGVPGVEHWGLEAAGGIVPAGERAARDRLTNFLRNGLALYGERRNFLAGTSTSRLSQDFRWGLLSIREVVERVESAALGFDPAGRKGADTYLSELIWREFYMQILWHWPEVLDADFSDKFGEVDWPGTDADFVRWRDGETGFPVVDAAMREMRQTGFMHNRARMITAMFLTKDLHVYWRKGESWFMQQLTDGDIASNNGGWQWSAGTGADAAPYFRIQNPWTQAARFDENGEYIRQWLPELRDVATKRLFEPPEGGGSLVPGYPAPMVDHAVERDRTLERFKGGLGRTSGSEL